MSSDQPQEQLLDAEKMQHTQLMDKLEKMTMGIERLVGLQDEAVRDQAAIWQLVKLIAWIQTGWAALFILALIFGAFGGTR